MAYSFEQVFAADPSNPANVARNAAVTIFAPGDVAQTPLTLTTPNGDPLANPLQVNNNGFGSAFMHATLDRVAWAGGNFTGFFTSYEGMKAEAVSARTAAQDAAENAATSATIRLDELIAAGGFEGPAGPLTNLTVGTVEATPGNPLTDAIIAAEVSTPGTATAMALTATYAVKKIHVFPLWGQSEMGGRAGDYSLLTDPTNPRILQFGCKVRTLRVASEPLDMHDTATGIGPGLQFARRYLATLPADDIVVLVPAAHGGTALSTNATLGWRWGVAGNLSAQGVAQLQDALIAIGAAYPGATVSVSALLYGQGETDSSTTNMVPAATYMADLDALIAGVRTTFANPTLPVILGQMIPESLGTGTRDEINAVHLNTPYRVAHTGIGLTEAGNSNGDLLHSNAKGQRIRGKNMFDEFQRVRVGLAPVTPDGDLPAALLFADDFNRADGVLTGQTTSFGGKVWSTVGTGTPRIFSNTAGVDPTGSVTRSLLTNTVMDGTIKALLSATSADCNEQLILRRNDANNELMLSRQNASSKVWTLFKRVANVSTAVYASAVPIMAGDIVEADMEGTTITIRINGAQIYTGTDPQFVLGASNNVGYSGTSNGARWDYLQFWTL